MRKNRALEKQEHEKNKSMRQKESVRKKRA